MSRQLPCHDNWDRFICFPLFCFLLFKLMWNKPCHFYVHNSVPNYNNHTYITNECAREWAWLWEHLPSGLKSNAPTVFVLPKFYYLFPIINYRQCLYLYFDIFNIFVTTTSYYSVPACPNVYCPCPMHHICRITTQAYIR